MDAGSHSHYRACWNVAFSSIDTVIAPLVGVDLQHHFAVLDGSAQIPVFWLGKLCFSTISDSVRSLSDNLCKTMRQWSINLLVQVLFSGMVMLNPRLSEAQQFQLLSAITRALEQLFLQHWLDERLMKGLIALACPDRGSRILVTYLVEVLKGLASRSTAAVAGEGGDLESESQQQQQQREDLKAARILCQEFGIDHMYVAAMPASVRRAVLVALTRDRDEDLVGSAQEQRRLMASPVCSITLEPLLLQSSGKVSLDVVAVIQSSGSRSGADDHAFLYRGTALYKWLAKPQVPISPETRSVVTPMDVYRLS